MELKMKKSNSSSSQRGQIALIIILLMVVIGTIALSVVSRSVVDIGISTQEENKIRAFSQAEAGIEDLLSQPQGLAGVFAGGTQGSGTLGGAPDQISYTYKIEAVGAGGGGWVLDEPLANGETTEIKLQGDASNPVLRFYWINTALADQMTDPEAALEITVYKSDNTITRYAVATDTSQNGFSTASGAGTVGSINYNATYDITPEPTATLVRVRALYNKASLAVVPQGGGSLPVQGYQATVTGQQGNNTAAVQVVQALPANPGIFDYVLWSGGGLSK
jgi:hypothetical protein